MPSRYALKCKGPIIGGFCYHQSILFRKLCGFRFEQANVSTAESVAILVHLEALDFASNQFVHNGLSFVGGDGNQLRVRTLIFKHYRELLLGNNKLTVAAPFLKVIAAYGEVAGKLGSKAQHAGFLIGLHGFRI